MKILAIETSCDETAIALIEAKGGLKAPSFKILENLVASQIKIHRPYGGVVPNLAKREHQKNLPILLKRIMNHGSKIKKQTERRKSIIHNSRFLIPDMIAVTVGPGLEPALWTGIEFAKNLYLKLKTKNSKIKLAGASHLKGHLNSFLLSQKTGIMKHESKIKNKKSIIHNSKFMIQSIFPAVALIVSGGHTILLLLKSLTNWKKLGETRDDAAGEAFDKVARLLELPYPGGPEIEKLAKEGNAHAINFPRPMINQKNYDFSFSGLKTSVLYYLRDIKNPNKTDVAASFQEAAVDVLTAKTIKAAKEYRAKSVMLSGGVAANNYLTKNLKLKTEGLGLNFFAPAKEFVTDNAAMIAASAYIDYLNKKSYRLIAQPNLMI